MESLLDIENAVEQLKPSELEELFLFLATRLRSQGGDNPPPRNLGKERIESWIQEDEAAYRDFREPR